MKQTTRQYQDLIAHNAGKLWARVRVAQLTFDLWYSRKMAALDSRDAELAGYQYRLELTKQQDIQHSLRNWKARL